MREPKKGDKVIFSKLSERDTKVQNNLEEILGIELIVESVCIPEDRQHNKWIELSTFLKINYPNVTVRGIDFDDGAEFVFVDEAQNGGYAVAEEGVKHDDGKNRLELFPMESFEAISEVLTFGAKKYADENWRKGMNWRRLIGALLRHLLAFATGEDRDKETGLLHIAHAGCCVVFLIAYQLGGLGTDDRVILKRNKKTEEAGIH